MLFILLSVISPHLHSDCRSSVDRLLVFGRYFVSPFKSVVFDMDSIQWVVNYIILIIFCAVRINLIGLMTTV